LHAVAAVLLGALALTACAGNTNSATPGGGTAPQVPASIGQAVVRNVSGQYSGTITDSTFGTGSASATLAQYQHVVGGALTASMGSVQLSNSIAVQATGAALAGKNAGPLPLVGAQAGSVNGNTCSFTLTATYTGSSNTLNGTYQAVHGCAGESGTFALTQDCSYPRGGLLDAASPWNGNAGAKPNHRISPC
jgi:hypothetical protein